MTKNPKPIHRTETIKNNNDNDNKNCFEKLLIMIFPTKFCEKTFLGRTGKRDKLGWRIKKAWKEINVRNKYIKNSTSPHYLPSIILRHEFESAHHPGLSPVELQCLGKYFSEKIFFSLHFTQSYHTANFDNANAELMTLDASNRTKNVLFNELQRTRW